MTSHLKKRGNSVTFWTLNRTPDFTEVWKEYGSEGIDGIMTDYPTRLKLWSDARRPDKAESKHVDLEMLLINSDDSEGPSLVVFK